MWDPEEGHLATGSADLCQGLSKDQVSRPQTVGTWGREGLPGLQAGGSAHGTPKPRVLTLKLLLY